MHHGRFFSKKRRALFILWMITGISSILTAQTKVIHAGRLIDGKSDQILEKVSIIVEGNKIIGVRKGFIKPEDGQALIDLKKRVVLPGLMDMHTHLIGEFSRNAYSEGFRMEPADYAFRMVGLARKTLYAGFTTVRDLGDRDNLTVSLKKAIGQGLVEGPRIYTAAKALATTGGHADPTNGVAELLEGDPGPKEGVVNSAEEGRKAVRQRYKDGADLIKITATGGVLSVAKSGDNPQFTVEELRAIVETANDYGFIVAAHAHGKEGMKRAVLAGVTSIEHGTYMDEEVMALMKERGTYLVPTLMAGDWVMRMAEIDGFFPEVVRRKAATIGPIMIGTFQKALASGVKIAFGTDTGVSPHGENAKEFELMVQAGMDPMRAIQSATRVASELLRINEELGTVEAGKLADLVAVEDNPLDNIKTLQNVVFVMKDGTVYKND